MNRRKKKNTRANLYRGGDGKSYYEANKRRRMSRYIKVGEYDPDHTASCTFYYEDQWKRNLCTESIQ